MLYLPQESPFFRNAKSENMIFEKVSINNVG